MKPLRFAFDVACSPEHAFETWGHRFSRWWPRDHSATGEAGLEVVLEPRVGGRIFERTSSGDEIDWGEITVWTPPDMIGYLWHLRRDRRDATDVEIRFVDRGNGTTRVEIEHSGWERLGSDAETWRDRNRGGWTTLIPHYEEAIGR